MRVLFGNHKCVTPASGAIGVYFLPRKIPLMRLKERVYLGLQLQLNGARERKTTSKE
jgi:hypothetical protein